LLFSAAYVISKHVHFNKVKELHVQNDANSEKRPRGRPPGRTAQGDESGLRLYRIAIGMIGTRGYAATTLRDVAKEAGVSVGLLYRYFPSKRAVVLKLYDELSAEYAQRSARMPTGKWRDRFSFALRTSLEVLGAHRQTLSSLFPILVGDAGDGLFAPGTAFSRRRVQGVFTQAVVQASDAPTKELAAALGRLLYLVHLAIIQWWLLDKSRGQRATAGLIKLIEQTLPVTSLVMRLPPIRKFIVAADGLFCEALLGEEAGSPSVNS
jgi:AcrR family transcriptional regulator